MNLEGLNVEVEFSGQEADELERAHELLGCDSYADTIRMLVTAGAVKLHEANASVTFPSPS